MDGPSFGRSMGEAMIALFAIGVTIGVIGSGLVWFVGGWLFRHLSIGWH